MFIRVVLICLLIVCINLRGTYPSGSTQEQYSQVIPVLQTPRITAPWMTSAELAALHLDAYYQVIIDVNIFRPLQRHSRGNINPYRLIGTIEKEQETVAYIYDTFKRRVHSVSLGEKFNKLTVEGVTRKSVTLRSKTGVITQLELGPIFLK